LHDFFSAAIQRMSIMASIIIVFTPVGGGGAPLSRAAVACPTPSAVEPAGAR
jgi:hypothetical protein